MSRPERDQAEPVHDESRRAWGSVPEEVLAAAEDFWRRHGAIPPPTFLAEATGIHPSVVRRALRRLVDEGSLAQPFGAGGAYIPTPIPRWPPSEDPLVKLLDRLPVEKREEAERYLRFLIEQG